MGFVTGSRFIKWRQIIDLRKYLRGENNMTKMIATLILTVFALANPSFAQNDKKGDVFCDVSGRVIKKLDNMTKYTPPPVRGQVQRVVNEAKRQHQETCNTKKGAGRAE
jgi:hypothetical protein